jgi:uncharacterized protein (TIGR03435 family)
MSRPLAAWLPKFACWTTILCSAPISVCQGTASTNPKTSGSSYAPHLTFDVASIREAPQGDMSYINNPPQSSFYHSDRVPVWGLILNAYDIKIANLLTGVPGWAMTVRYDVTAKSDSATDEVLAKLSDLDAYAEKHHMLRALLADRFKLQMHSETRVSTTYELVTTAQTPNLMTPVVGDVARTVSTCDIHFPAKGREIQSRGCPFPILLSTLRQEFGTDIVDHTGLSGMYAYHLMWAPADMPIREVEERYPNLRDAVREQLGLELKPTKGPVTFWVVDHIERPTPN